MNLSVTSYANTLIEPFQSDFMTEIKDVLKAAEKALGKDFTETEITAIVTNAVHNKTVALLANVRDQLKLDHNDPEQVFMTIFLARVAKRYAEFVEQAKIDGSFSLTSLMTALDDMIRPEPLESYVYQFSPFEPHAILVSRFIGLTNVLYSVDYENHPAKEESDDEASSKAQD